MTKAGPSDIGAAALPHRRDRIFAVDAARAVAVVGMLAINVGPKDGEGVWGRLYTLPHGRASLLFVLIAGVGVSLLTRRVRRRDSPDVGRSWRALLWRSAVLFVAGLALQLLDHDVSVILAIYGLLFVLAGLVMRVADRVLLGLAVTMTVVGPVVWWGAQVVAGRPYTYEPAALGDPPGQVLHTLVLSGPYPLVTWVAPFLFGMWLGRLDLTRTATRWRMVALGALAGVGAPVVTMALTALLGEPSELDPALLVTDVAHGQMPLWLVGGTGAGVFVLGVLLLVEDRAGRWLWPLVATGQLALTVYVAHLLALHWLRPAPHSLAQGVLITVVMVVVAALGALAWRARFRRGPLELLIRPPSTWR